MLVAIEIPEGVDVFNALVQLERVEREAHATAEGGESERLAELISQGVGLVARAAQAAGREPAFTLDDAERRSVLNTLYEIERRGFDLYEVQEKLKARLVGRYA